MARKKKQKDGIEIVDLTERHLQDYIVALHDIALEQPPPSTISRGGVDIVIAPTTRQMVDEFDKVLRSTDLSEIKTRSAGRVYVASLSGWLQSPAYQTEHDVLSEKPWVLRLIDKTLNEQAEALFEHEAMSYCVAAQEAGWFMGDVDFDDLADIEPYATAVLRAYNEAVSIPPN